MARVTVTELAGTLEQLQAQMAEISRRMQMLEKGAVGPHRRSRLPVAAAAAARRRAGRHHGRGTARHLGRHRRVPGSARPHPADSIGQHKCMGTTGARVDPGVPQVARLVLWGSLSSCAPVGYRRFGRVANPPQAASLPHTGYLGGAMKLNITIDEKTYEVEVEAAEPESPAAAPHNVSGLNIGSAPLRVPAGAAPVAPPADSTAGE